MSDYLIGGSPAIKRIRSLLTKLSAETSPLVITGDPGVGKTLLSLRIHAHSLLKDRELEIVNFKILSERDQRVRLLGGSPPELPTTRRSVLELPTTVVLKHIDCASKFLQEQLVNAILSSTVIRLGTEDERPVRCRLIFVFNSHPQQLFKTGAIIPGLSKILAKYKLIYVPTLKERKEDIPELAQHFFTQFQIARRKPLDNNFVKLLQRNKWNENILELKSFVKTLQVMPDDVAIRQKDRIQLAKMNLMIDEGKEFSLKDSLSKTEQWFIDKALKKHEGIQAKAAKSLGITDRTIRHSMKTDSF
jgi:DNA-binding NtrC family response regulator